MAHDKRLAEAVALVETAGYVVKAPTIGGQHPDDNAVDFFAKSMKHKLAQSRAKGRGGWADPLDCSHKTLAEWFVGHLTKTNPDNMVDLANLAMMLHLREAMPHHLQDALQAAAQAAIQADGRVVVPVEPTEAMHRAAARVDDAAYTSGSQHGAADEDIWHAMVAARPGAQP